MVDLVLLEETIKLTLRKYPEGLDSGRLENYVVGTLGKRGQPVDMDLYDDLISDLIRRKVVESVKVMVEGYAPVSIAQENGYKLN